MMLNKNNKFTLWYISILLTIVFLGCIPYVEKNSGDNTLTDKYGDCIIGICKNDLCKISYDSAVAFFSPKNLSKVGTLKYVEYLSNFHCYDLTIPSCRFPENWVKKEDLDSLIKMTNNKTRCPQLHLTSIYSNLEDLDSAYIQSSTVGKESLRLINSYFLKEYPCPIVYDIDSIIKMKDL